MCLLNLRALRTMLNLQDFPNSLNSLRTITGGTLPRWLRKKMGEPPKDTLYVNRKIRKKKDLWRKKNPTKQTQNNVNFGCEMNHQNTAYQVILKWPPYFPLVGGTLFRSRFHHLEKGHVFTRLAEDWTLERILKHPSWSHLHQLGKLGTSSEGGSNFTRNNGGEKSSGRVWFFFWVKVQQEAIPHILGGDNVARSSAFGIGFVYSKSALKTWRIFVFEANIF